MYQVLHVMELIIHFRKYVKVSGSCSLRSASSLVLHLSCTVLRRNLIVGCLGQVKVDGSITAAVKLYFIIFCDGNTLSVKSQYLQSSKKIDNCFQQFSNSYALKDEYYHNLSSDDT